jgi:DNA polymerase I-like protein with 3'-5' exonuclease and polymerase domains
MTFYWEYTTESRQNGRTTIALDAVTKRPIKQSVFNYPVQSLATAEIIPIALTALFRRCKRRALRVLFVNTIHDSVVCEVHKDDIAAFVEEVKPAFTTDVFKYLARYYGLQFNVPLGCEVKWGTHWGEGEEVKYDMSPARA